MFFVSTTHETVECFVAQESFRGNREYKIRGVAVAGIPSDRDVKKELSASLDKISWLFNYAPVGIVFINSYMCGNAFEALVGAIYLDRGYRACKHFMEHRIIGPYINLEKISRKEVNFKSKLIEWSQKNRVELTFELITQSHDQCFSPTFESEVLIEGIPAGRGIGYSKKESQQRAAHEAMGKIKDSAFMESVLAAKSVREAPQEEVMLPREEAVETVISAVSEEIGISELNEQIISEAEEMAFKEVK